MNCKRAEELLVEIDTAIKNISSFENVNELEGSYFAKFLVVFICGLYEECIESIINEMAARLNSKEIASYINKAMDNKFRSPNIENICQTLSMFNKNWSKEIKRLPNENKLAMNSIKENKDAMAHGLQSTITLSQIYDFYKKSRIVIEKIDSIVLDRKQ